VDAVHPGGIDDMVCPTVGAEHHTLHNMIRMHCCVQIAPRATRCRKCGSQELRPKAKEARKVWAPDVSDVNGIKPLDAGPPVPASARHHATNPLLPCFLPLRIRDPVDAGGGLVRVSPEVERRYARP